MKVDSSRTNEEISQTVRRWVTQVVVGLELCPFAKRELDNERLRFAVTKASNEESLLRDLQTELALIVEDDSIETTLLIHPQVLQDFSAYNQFLDYADALLVEMNLEGVYQIASFHPDYQFADCTADDVRNFTNKSPYPMLHIICEETLEKAIASYPDIDEVPERNQALLQSLGQNKMMALYKACLNTGD